MRKLYMLWCCLWAATAFANSSQPTLYNYLMEVNAQWAKQPECAAVTSQTAMPHNTTFNQWIATHLQLVEQTLRQRSTGHLTLQQRQNRLQLLDELNGYWKNGVFPKNDYLCYKNPVFIDRAGTHCAVGYLMQQSGHETLARTIDGNEKFAYVHQIQTPGVKNWADAHGFTVDELAWIQPGYPPALNADDLDGGLNGTVNTVVVDNSSNILYVAGEFSASTGGVSCNNIAAWISGFAGFDWVPLTGGGVNGPVSAMLLHNQKLYVGGNFTMAGSTAVKNVAVYDIAQGQWQAMGTLDSTVTCFAVYNNAVYAGGKFTGMLSKWNGTAWQDVAQGFLYGEGVRTLEVYDNQLVIGGNFELATGALRRHVATYDGTYMGMLGFGTLTPVNDFATYRGKLYAGCDLYYLTDSSGIAYYENGDWVNEVSPSQEMLGIGFTGVAVKRIVPVGNQLFAAGEFGCFWGMTFGSNLMALTHQVQDTLTHVVMSPLANTDGAINDIALPGGNTLYFGGSFIHNGYVDTLNHIAQMQVQYTGIAPTGGKLAVSLYPNPATADVTIHTGEEMPLSQVTVTDMAGRKVMQQNLQAGANRVTLQGLSAGVYTVTVRGNGKTGVARLVKSNN